ncbi:hypothetical protein E2C01_001529 [Portunus trituberculatus]|uniref:Uncharacterized protein n=1 Tax=Portunus trituberculatus TaxID=210409 RepID=A0A5B7CGV4_PORTR|nr:hypothetical protein [Portunus trituberculatus]
MSRSPRHQQCSSSVSGSRLWKASQEPFFLLAVAAVLGASASFAMHAMAAEGSSNRRPTSSVYVL